MSRQLFRWIYLGFNLKRWIVLFLVAAGIAGLGIAYLLRAAYLAISFPDEIYWITLQFIPRWLRGLLFLLTAVTLAGLSGWKLRTWVVQVAGREPTDQVDVISTAYRNLRLSRGPNVVVIGGGTGLANILRSLKEITANISAIVTVADDGGSSGRLRRDLGVIPPGDIRNCIAALAEDESLVTQLFRYRFEQLEGNSISGHSFGNLFLTAMAEVSGGMEAAIDETCRVLQVNGRIIPASLDDVTLVGMFDGDIEIRGESEISNQGYPPKWVSLSPDAIEANPKAVKAISDADLILIGPGSLYTSIIPNILVPGVSEAIGASSAPRIFVVNVATQYGETNGYSAARHYEVLRSHAGCEELATVVLANSDLSSESFPAEWRSQPVLTDVEADYGSAKLITSNLVDETKRYRHDGAKVMKSAMQIFLRNQ